MADASTPTFGFKLAYKNPMGDYTPSTNDKPVASNTTDSTPIFGFKLDYKNPMDDNTPSTNDKSVASNNTDSPSIFSPLDFMQGSSVPSYDYSGMTAMAENEGYVEGNLMGRSSGGFFGFGCDPFCSIGAPLLLGAALTGSMGGSMGASGMMFPSATDFLPPNGPGGFSFLGGFDSLARGNFGNPLTRLFTGGIFG